MTGADAGGLLWEAGRIVRVGDADAVRRAARSRGLPVRDEGDRIILPGFVDAHMHLLHVAIQQRRPVLGGAGSQEEALARVAEWAAAHPQGSIIAEGWDESEWSVPDARFTRHELDAIVADRPLVLRRVCGHIAVANTPALDAVRRRWRDPALVHDDGVLLEDPSLYLNEVLPEPPEVVDAAVDEACQVAHRVGVTTVAAYEQAPFRAGLQRAAATGRLTVRVHSNIYVQQLPGERARGFRTGRPAVAPGDDGADPAAWRPPVASGGLQDLDDEDACRRLAAGDPHLTEHSAPVPPAEGGSSPWLWDGGLKVFLDGSIGGHTALLQEPYQDRPGEHGLRNWSPDHLRRLFQAAGEASIQVHAHAIGDAAIAEGLDAFSALLDDDQGIRSVHAEGKGGAEREGKGEGEREGEREPPPHRFEHFELPDDDAVRRTAALGLIACCQPNFVGGWSGPGGLYEERLGSRFHRNNRFRTYLDAGVRLAFGSDGMPFGPLEGISAALRHPVAEERLPVDVALQLYTRDAARSLGRDDLGVLRPGAMADLILLDRDDLEGDPADWSVAATWTGGVLRWDQAREADGRREE